MFGSANRLTYNLNYDTNFYGAVLQMREVYLASHSVTSILLTLLLLYFNLWTPPLFIVCRCFCVYVLYAEYTFFVLLFIIEYVGEFHDKAGIARAREKMYEEQHKGSYMFYFVNPYSGSICCKDATDEKSQYGWARLINHSRKRPNCVAMAIRNPDSKLHSLRAEPKLIFIAKRDINR